MLVVIKKTPNLKWSRISLRIPLKNKISINQHLSGKNKVSHRHIKLVAVFKGA